MLTILFSPQIWVQRHSYQIIHVHTPVLVHLPIDVLALLMTLIVPVFAHVLTPPPLLCHLVYENGADVSVPSPEAQRNLVYLPILKMTVEIWQWINPVEPTDVHVSERGESATQCCVLNVRVKASSCHSHSHNPHYEVDCSPFQDPLAEACRNSSIQHMQHKVRLWFEQFRRHPCSWPRQQGFVYRSKWGLGYYLTESARKGDFIIGTTCPISPLHRRKFNIPPEYVGDIIYDPTVRSREYVFSFPLIFISLLIPLLSTVLLQHIQTDNTCSNSIPYSPSTELQPATNQNTSTTLLGTTPTSVPMVHIKTPLSPSFGYSQKKKKKTESKFVLFLDSPPRQQRTSYRHFRM